MIGGPIAKHVQEAADILNSLESPNMTNPSLIAQMEEALNDVELMYHCGKHVEQLLQSALAEMPRWTMCSEQLPEKTDVYQVAFSNGGQWFGHFRVNGQKWLIYDEGRDEPLSGQVTMWAPLLQLDEGNDK